MTVTTGGESSGRVSGVEDALADLDELKETLRRAAGGQEGATRLQQAVQDYVRDHHEALTMAAAAVGEEVRSQILAQLYRWRAQLGQQLPTGESTPTPARPAKASSTP
ncbi:MAG TPA: hypothetical protein VFM01_02585 [Nakamurella sp.]|nr:hypothetical protein [Nakamurella sp.]